MAKSGRSKPSWKTRVVSQPPSVRNTGCVELGQVVAVLGHGVSSVPTRLSTLEASGTVSHREGCREAVVLDAPTPEGAVELIGRDAELAALVERLSGRRLVTVTGPGGVGKTALARAGARPPRGRLRARRPRRRPHARRRARRRRRRHRRPARLRLVPGHARLAHRGPGPAAGRQLRARHRRGRRRRRPAPRLVPEPDGDRHEPVAPRPAVGVARGARARSAVPARGDRRARQRIGAAVRRARPRRRRGARSRARLQPWPPCAASSTACPSRSSSPRPAPAPWRRRRSWPGSGTGSRCSPARATAVPAATAASPTPSTGPTGCSRPRPPRCSIGSGSAAARSTSRVPSRAAPTSGSTRCRRPTRSRCSSPRRSWSPSRSAPACASACSRPSGRSPSTACGPHGVLEEARARLADHVVDDVVGFLAAGGYRWDRATVTGLLARYDDIVASLRWCLATMPTSELAEHRSMLLAAVLWGVVHQGHTDEIAELCEQVLGPLARQRPSPLRGRGGDRARPAALPGGRSRRRHGPRRGGRSPRPTPIPPRR